MDLEVAMPVDIGKVGLNCIRALPAAGDLDHDFRDTRHGAPDLLNLRSAELKRGVASAPAVAHQIKIVQSPTTGQTNSLRHRRTPN